MKSNALVFDLDDTLIDTKVRHYRVLYDYLKKHKVQGLPYAEYLSIRRKKEWSNSHIIKNLYPHLEDDFRFFWKENIETEYYLEYDVELVSTKLLSEAKQQNSLILLSLRTNADLAKKQLNSFSFAHLFESVFFVAHSDQNPKTSILKSLKPQYNNTVFFGDAKTDLFAATNAEVGFCCVSTGLYDLDHQRSFININDALLNTLL